MMRDTEREVCETKNQELQHECGLVRVTTTGTIVDGSSGGGERSAEVACISPALDSETQYGV